MTESDKIYCLTCGAENLLTAENCVTCGVEMVRPHPIQLAGGDIYALRCTSCGRRLPVVKTEGTTTCLSCGLTHDIIPGEGYLTVKPAPGLPSREAEQDYLLADEPAAINPPILPELDPELQELAAAKQERNTRIKELETTIRGKTMQLNDRLSRRKGGRVILILSLMGIVFAFVDRGLLKIFHSDKVDPVILILSVFFFIIGLVLMLASGKKGIENLEQEINTRKKELENLQTPQSAGSIQGGNQ